MADPDRPTPAPRRRSRVLALAACAMAASVFASPAPAQQDADGRGDAEAIAKLTAQNLRVLSGRFHKILEFRLQGLYKCGFETHVELEGKFKALKSSSPDRADAVAILRTYLDSYGVDAACLKQLGLAETVFHDEERRLFKPLDGLIAAMCATEFNAGAREADCRSRLLSALSDLDPNCASVQVDNPRSEYEVFPCMAGDYMIGRDLTKTAKVPRLVGEARAFLQGVRSALSDPEGRARAVELYSLYPAQGRDGEASRQRFLAMWTMLNASTHSLTSYTQGYYHHFARETLFRERSAEAAVDAFVATRLLVDEYRTLFRWARDRGVRFSIGADRVDGMNRHDFMSAYLACRYRAEPRFLHESLPRLLGTVYESFDFVSHLKEGDSLGVAWRAMKSDLRRYKSGVRWGRAFCAGET